MINDLFDTRFGYESLNVYINDTEIPNNFVADFITKIEMDCKLASWHVKLVIIADNKLFTLTVNKSVQELTPEDTIRIVLEDKNHTVIDRRFNFVTSSNLGYDSIQGNFYRVMFIDVYSYICVNPEFTKYITAHGYSGFPIEIVRQVFMDAFVPIVEINKTRKEKTIDMEVKQFKTKVPTGDSMYDYFVMDKTIKDNLTELVGMYNILIFQDFQKMYIWQNISCDQLELINDKDGTELYTDEASQLYANYICEKIKMPSGTDTLGRINFKVSRNMGGIHHEVQKLDFDDFLTMITMNNNSDSYRFSAQTLDTPSASKYATLGFLVKKSFFKYINNNTLIIFTRPFFKNINVGTKVSVRVHANTEFQGDQREGDPEYNGVWLIVQSTISTIGQHLICRLVLKRFDNMKSNNGASVSKKQSSQQGSAYGLNKPLNAKSGKLGDVSRDKLEEDELKKDVDQRVAKVGQNSNNGWEKKKAQNSGLTKSEDSIYRVKDKKEGILDSLKKARKTFLEYKKEAMLQVQRVKSGIDEAIKPIKEIYDSVDQVVDSVQQLTGSVNGLVQEVKGDIDSVKNGADRFKNFIHIKRDTDKVKEEKITKSKDLNEVAFRINNDLGTNITAEDLERMIKNKSYSPIIERELNKYYQEFTQLSKK